MLLTILCRARLHLARWLVQPRPPCERCGSTRHETRGHYVLHDDH